MNTSLARNPKTRPSHPLQQAWHQLAARWADHLEAVRQQREMESMSELSAETLRDIGAPERWVERAIQRREGEALRLSDLRQWRHG